MPTISPDSGYLTVLNLFRTDSRDKQEQLLGAMRQIVDAAAYEGWVSSTVHSGVDAIGTANFIQWKKREDLERRYASDEFKHQMPLFNELTTAIRLLQTEVVHTLRPASEGDRTEIDPGRDNYTVIEILSVEPENLQELATAICTGSDWLTEVPGFRSQSVLKGKALRGKFAQRLDGAFVVLYSQWAGKAEYDSFIAVPEAEQPADRSERRKVLEALVTDIDSNTYRVVHSRSAGA